MFKRIITVSSAAALSLAALVASPAIAQDAAFGAKTVGAMSVESRGRALNSRDVLRQGGMATAGALRWTPAPSVPGSSAAIGVGAVGAMQRETRGVATNAAEVYRSGGAIVARSVRWVSTSARS